MCRGSSSSRALKLNFPPSPVVFTDLAGLVRMCISRAGACSTMATIMVHIRAATVPTLQNCSLVLHKQHSPLAQPGVEADLAETQHIIVFTYSAVESYFHACVSRQIFAYSATGRE